MNFKKIVMTVAALATMSACSSQSTSLSSETLDATTPSETVVASQAQTYATLLEAFQAGWANSDDSTKGFLVSENGGFEVRHYQDEATVKESASACDGLVDQTTIDEQVALRVSQYDALRDGFASFVADTTFESGSERDVTDDELVTRLDLNSTDGRFTLGIYTDGTVRLKNVMSNDVEWYHVDETTVSSLSTLINDNYVTISPDNADLLTCWEAASLGL